MTKKIARTGGFLFFIVLATLPLWLLQGEYVRGVGVQALTVAALAVSWNIIGGFGGRFSFGHAAFFGVGAYTSTLLLIHANISPWVGGLIGTVVAGLLALFVGSFSLHLRGIYFALVTFVFGLILLLLFRYFVGFTGGDVGLSPPLSEPSLGMLQFRGQIGYYYVALGVLAGYVMISKVISKSSFGYRLRGLRDDEEVAEALGVATTKVKLQAFVLSAMMVAFVGTLVAQHNLFIDPGSAFGVDRSIEMALGAILGGVGTVWGPVVGGFAIVLISEWTNIGLGDVLAGADTIAYGIVLMAVALWLPDGIISIARRLTRIWRRRSTVSTTGVQEKQEMIDKAEAK
jgi:branched-chain amino acid transport system permease protein